jgi:hypothetical protein
LPYSRLCHELLTLGFVKVTSGYAKKGGSLRQTAKKGETLMGSARNLSICTIGGEMIIVLMRHYKT